MPYIYFSRNQPAHPMLARSLMSGVVEADTLDEGKAKLAALLDRTGKGFTRADEFDFLNLDSAERTDSGVPAIMMRED